MPSPPRQPARPAGGLAAARKLLTDAQLIAFFRAAGAWEHPRAAKMVCDDLDKGRTLDGIFAMQDDDNPEGFPCLEMELKVRRLSARVFRITLGHHGDTVGDGGVFRVAYGGNGEVVRMEPESFWTH